MQAVYSEQKIKALNFSPYDVDATKNNITSVGLGGTCFSYFLFFSFRAKKAGFEFLSLG
jgi:hypothetical protein